MFLVVLYHSTVFWTGNWFTKDPIFSSATLGALSGWLNSFHIYAFALVSGYLFYHLKCQKGKYEKFIPFVVNKVKRLLIPYVFVSVLWVIPIQGYFFHYNVKNIFYNYILAVSPGQLWFLVMLFDVFVLFWPFSDFFRQHGWLGAIVVLSMYGVGFLGSLFATNVFMIWTALRYMPFFWLGFKLCQHGSRCVRKIPAVLWFIASILTNAFAQYLDGLDTNFFKLLKIFFSFASCVIGAIMAFVVLQKLADVIKWDTKVFKFFSERSMGVYLLHQQIIFVCIYWLNGLVHPYLHVAINFIVSTVVSLSISTALMRFRITRFLIGEK